MSGPRPETYWDAVIIGAGHNALVTAAYLATAGQRTLVLEHRERVGGAADTVQLARGVRVPALAHTIGRLRPSVQKDLRLSMYGLSLMAPEVRVFAPSPSGGAVTLKVRDVQLLVSLLSTTSLLPLFAMPVASFQ